MSPTGQRHWCMTRRRWECLKLWVNQSILINQSIQVRDFDSNVTTWRSLPEMLAWVQDKTNVSWSEDLPGLFIFCHFHKIYYNSGENATEPSLYPPHKLWTGCMPVYGKDKTKWVHGFIQILIKFQANERSNWISVGRFEIRSTWRHCRCRATVVCASSGIR